MTKQQYRGRTDISRIVRGAIRDYNNQHPDNKIIGWGVSSLTKRIVGDLKEHFQKLFAQRDDYRRVCQENYKMQKLLKVCLKTMYLQNDAVAHSTDDMSNWVIKDELVENIKEVLNEDS